MGILKLMKLSFAAAIACYAISFMGMRMSGLNGDNLPETVITAYAKSSGDMKTLDINRDIEAKGIEEMEVAMTSTGIKLVPSQDGKIHIRLSGLVSGNTVDLQALQVGNKIDIHLKQGEKPGFVFFNDGDKGEMEIHVPATINSVEVRTVSGDLNFGNLKLAKLKIKTVSGDVDLDSTEAGEITWQTVSGDWGSNSTLTNFDGKSVSGDYDISTKTANPTIKAASTSGDLKVKFANAPDLKLNFHSTSGDAEIKTMAMKHSGDEDLNTTLGAGKGSLVFKSISGSLTIEQ